MDSRRSLLGKVLGIAVGVPFMSVSLDTKEFDEHPAVSLLERFVNAFKAPLVVLKHYTVFILTADGEWIKGTPVSGVEKTDHSVVLKFHKIGLSQEIQLVAMRLFDENRKFVAQKQFAQQLDMLVGDVLNLTYTFEITS